MCCMFNQSGVCSCRVVMVFTRKYESEMQSLESVLPPETRDHPLLPLWHALVRNKRNGMFLFTFIIMGSTVRMYVHIA